VPGSQAEYRQGKDIIRRAEKRMAEEGKEKKQGVNNGKLS
jgi:hypothetical protein